MPILRERSTLLRVLRPLRLRDELARSFQSDPAGTALLFLAVLFAVKFAVDDHHPSYRHLSRRFSSEVMPQLMPTPIIDNRKMIPNTPSVLKLAASTDSV